MPFASKVHHRRRRLAGLSSALLVCLATPAIGDAPPESLTAADPAARMLAGAGADEYWDVRARLQDGAYFFARFWVANEGPGSHTGIAMGTFLAPDGAKADFRYGRERERWTLAGDGRYIRIASAVLDLREPTGRIELDTNKQGIKIYLSFPMERSPPSPCARRDATSGFDVLALGAPLDGLAWTKEMASPLAAKGTIDVTHGWSAEGEIANVHRSIEMSARDGDVAVFASAVVAPNGRRSACVAVLRGSSLLYQSRVARVEVAPTALERGDPSYPVPDHLRFGDERLEVTVLPARQLLMINPLDAVPQPFRLLLGLRSQPRWLWAEGTWHLRLAGGDGRKPLELRGSGVTAVSYSNPWSGAHR